jgi:hypothetical protein
MFVRCKAATKLRCRLGVKLNVKNMNHIPHWQLLLLAYFAIVGLPVFAAHRYLKNKVLKQKGCKQLAIYFLILMATTLALNCFCLIIYYSFIFKKQ